MFKKIIISVTLVFTYLFSSNIQSAAKIEKKVSLINLIKNSQFKEALAACDTDDINQIDENGNTPLIYAAINYNLELIAELMRKGADISIRNNEDKIFLYYLDEGKKKECLKKYSFINNLKYMNSINDEKSNKIFQDEHKQLIFRLIEGNKFSSRYDDTKKIINYLNDPLKHIWNQNYINHILKLMIGTIADNNLKYFSELLKFNKEIINFRYEHEMTLLMYACLHNKLTIARILIENGADKNLKNIGGKDALYFANEGKNPKLIQLLSKTPVISTKRKSNETDLSTKTARQVKRKINAKVDGKEEKEESEFESDLKIEKQDKGFLGRLRGPLKTIYVTKVTQNLQKNAFVEMLRYIRRSDLRNLERLLTPEGFYSNLSDKDQTTLLMHAVKEKKLKIVKLLLDNNAAINARDKSGNTAIKWALKMAKEDKKGNGLEKYKEIFEFLHFRGAALDFKDTEVGFLILNFYTKYKKGRETCICGSDFTEKLIDARVEHIKNHLPFNTRHICILGNCEKLNSYFSNETDLSQHMEVCHKYRIKPKDTKKIQDKTSLSVKKDELLDDIDELSDAASDEEESIERIIKRAKEQCKCGVFVNRLDSHILNVHTDVTEYECKECKIPTYLANNSSLSRHKRERHAVKKEFKPVKKESKEEAESDKEELADAVEEESTERTAELEKKERCECGIIVLKRNMKSHIKNVHTTVTPFECKNCKIPTYLANKSSLNKHIIQYHPEKEEAGSGKEEAESEDFTQELAEVQQAPEVTEGASEMPATVSQSSSSSSTISMPLAIPELHEMPLPMPDFTLGGIPTLHEMPLPGLDLPLGGIPTGEPLVEPSISDFLNEGFSALLPPIGQLSGQEPLPNFLIGSPIGEIPGTQVEEDDK